MQRSRFGEFSRMTNLPGVMKHGTKPDDASIARHAEPLKLREDSARSLIHKLCMTDQTIRRTKDAEQFVSFAFVP